MAAHEHLWAPWRIGYIKGDNPPEAEENDEQLAWLPGADRECFICRAVARDSSDDEKSLLVYRGQHALVLLNRYPYNNGHLLVAPRNHKARLDELDGGEQADISDQLQRMVVRLEQVMEAQGFNIGLNLGAAAGAGLPGHLHWHIVPRWNGDTNFVTTIDAVRVIPQSLSEAWRLLRE